MICGLQVGDFGHAMLAKEKDTSACTLHKLSGVPRAVMRIASVLCYLHFVSFLDCILQNHYVSSVLR